MIDICLMLAAALAAAPVSDGAAGGGAVHPACGSEVFECEDLKITLVGKAQNYGGDTFTCDPDILSPKSVNIHPAGGKAYVHSLEGMQSVVYRFPELEKLGTIEHRFSSADTSLWAASSGLYHFNNEFSDPLTFCGKPVESVFTHGGRYLWITYYRRSYDTNAQNPSAVVVVDTQQDSIVRAFETGPLPKMIAASPDGKRLAVTHWGDNTVGLMDISGANPSDWHYVANVVVDQKLKLKFKPSEQVNRDQGSGLSLRGTLFTADGKYLLVGCMGGSGGIAVIDVERCSYLGKILGIKSNVRHLICKSGFLYASINKAGYVQRTDMQQVRNAIKALESGERSVRIENWDSCKVFPGARTIVASPDGKYIFAACHYSSRIAVVDTGTMSMIGSVRADSYPVGLAISGDGKYLVSTSQGSGGLGGNAVDIYRIDYR